MMRRFIFLLACLPTPALAQSATQTGQALVARSVGEYVCKVDATEEHGLKLINGQALSRIGYAMLFDKIGTAFGAGDGSTTFNVPDARGRVFGMVGQGVFTSAFAAAAVTVGTDTIAVSANDSLYTGAAVVLSTSGAAPTGLIAGSTYYAIRVSSTSVKLASSLANAVAGTAIDITGQGSGSHTLTASLTDRALGAYVGEETHALTVAEMPSHTHNVETVQTASQNAFGGGDVRANSTTKTTTATGGSGGHNLMQPTVFAGYCFIYTGAPN